MHDRFYRLVEKQITRMLSLWVKPAVLPEHPQAVIDPEKPVLYVLEKGGLADRATLNQVCQKFNLPPPGAQLDYGNLQESSSVDVLRHRQGFVMRRHRLVRSQRLKRLVNTRLTQNPGDLQIVPVGIYWGREPDKEVSFWSLFFSENWQIGGRTRKFFTTLFYGRDTLLNFSEPLSIDALIDTYANSEGPTNDQPDNKAISAELVQHKLSRILRVHFRQRRIASVGPDQSHRRMLVSEVLQDKAVTDVINNEAANDHNKIQRLQRQAEKYANEIAADMSYPTVRVLHRLMSRLWTQLYDGVEVAGIDRLNKAASGREVIYVPCHRSHIDYLLLSYLLYINGHSLPHIAAGINLNLPLVGGLLRRGGAFFLRRSFAGNKLYATVFKAYLSTILQRGHAIEYFVEGGRSRTGRLLPPKGGMLAMTVNAYLRNPSTPVVFIPVYLGYERLLEGRAFTSELAGGKKQKETVFALLKSLRTLREEYGSVFVNFGTPIELDQLLDKHHQTWRDAPTETDRPTWLTPVITELGNTIMQHINSAAYINPINLLATALLATPRGVLSQQDLKHQMALYHDLLFNLAKNSTLVVPAIDFDEAIEHGQKLGFVQKSDDPLGTLISIKPGRAAPLTYFSNNIQHLLTLPSLIACCFLNHAVRSYQDISKLVSYAHPFLSSEFFLPDDPHATRVDETLNALKSCNLLRMQDDNYRRAPAGSTEAVSLMRLAEVVMPSLERYFLAASVLVPAGQNGIDKMALAHRCEACANRLAHTHGKNASDLYDKHLLESLLSTLAKTHYVHQREELFVASEALNEIAQQTRTLLPEQTRHAILNAALESNHQQK